MRGARGQYFHEFLKGREYVKFISAIIQPSKQNDLKQGLAEIGVHGMTATEVNGFGRQKGHTEVYRSAEYVVDYLPKLKIDVAVDDEKLDEVITVITNVCNTGKIGDGKVFVSDLDQVVRIRTGEIDNEAL